MVYEPYHRYEHGVVATNSFWKARPMLVAYVLAVSFTVGLLINRTPSRDAAVPALAGGAQGDDHAATESDKPQPPLWLQLFRPSQPTARLMLRMALPMLAVADGSAEEAEHRNLLVYVTGKSGPEQPETFFQSMLPFLRPAHEPPPTNTPPPNTPPPNTPPPTPGEKPAEQPPPPPVPPKPPGTPVDAGKSIGGGLPLVGIYHTHDWESYISEFPALAVKGPQDLGKVRSENHKEKTVLDLGHQVALRLRDLGVSTVHAPFRHSADGYDYAYTMSRNTAKQIVKEASSVKVLIDIHRDGAWGLNATTTIAGQKVAQIRCIIGERQPNWEQNKRFCDSLMGRLEKRYPGLTLPTRVQGGPYNQDLMPGAILLEIGNAMNQYAEAQRAAGYLAEVLGEQVKAGDYPH